MEDQSSKNPNLRLANLNQRKMCQSSLTKHCEIAKLALICSLEPCKRYLFVLIHICRKKVFANSHCKFYDAMTHFRALSISDILIADPLMAM